MPKKKRIKTYNTPPRRIGRPPKSADGNPRVTLSVKVSSEVRDYLRQFPGGQSDRVEECVRGSWSFAAWKAKKNADR